MSDPSNTSPSAAEASQKKGPTTPDPEHSESALRWIPPYHHTNYVHVKDKWIGRRLVDVWSSEFPYYPREAYVAAVKDGRLSVTQGVRGPMVTSDDPAGPVLERRRVIHHSRHRHEPPVLNCGPVVIEHFVPMNMLLQTSENWSTSGLCVINKPASMLVHPAGRFARNTLTQMLIDGEFVFAPAVDKNLCASPETVATRRAELRKTIMEKTLHPVHRLDKGTSGLVLLATSAECSSFIRKLLDAKSREGTTDESKRKRPRNESDAEADDAEAVTCEKMYLARVVGRLDLPPGADRIVVDRALYCSDPASGRRICLSESEQEKYLVDGTLSSPGEPSTLPGNIQLARSIFSPLRYDAESNETIVRCFPVTGRTHQLRVHLQLLGHPIVLDHFYPTTSSVAAHQDRRRAQILDLFPCVSRHWVGEPRQPACETCDECKRIRSEATADNSPSYTLADELCRYGGVIDKQDSPVICLHANSFKLFGLGAEGAELVLEVAPPAWL